MAVRTTIVIPEPLPHKLRQHAQQSGSSMRALIVRAIEQTYSEPRKGRNVTGPLVKGKHKRGPGFPTDENPHDLVFS
jgi:hypothetical protein